MRRTIKELRDYLLGLTNDVVFQLNGINGIVIPFSQNKFVLSFGDEAVQEFSDVDVMLHAPVLNGKSFAEICGDIWFDT